MDTPTSRRVVVRELLRVITSGKMYPMRRTFMSIHWPAEHPAESAEITRFSSRIRPIGSSYLLGSRDEGVRNSCVTGLKTPSHFSKHVAGYLLILGSFPCEPGFMGFLRVIWKS